MGSKYFSALEIDAIGEILNISLGASATAVSTMLNNRVDITTPIVNVISKDEFRMDKVEPAVGVEITYVSGLEGSNVMLLKRHDVKVIVEMLMGMAMSDEEFELNEINISAVCEVMNQMMGASATALSEFLGQMVNISTPVSFEVKSEEEFVEKYFEEGGSKVVVGFTLRIADRLESEFFNVMPIELAKSLVKGFLPEDAIVPYDPANPAGDAAPAAAPEPVAEESGNGVVNQDEADAMIAAMLAQAEAEEAAPAPAPAPETGSGSGALDQDEADAMIAAMLAQAEAEAAAPAPAPTPQLEVQQAAPAPQPVPAAPQAAPVQPQVIQQTMSPDVAMMQMQMMQQMMQQMQQMQQKMEEQKEQKKPAEPKMINVQPVARPSLNQDKDIVLEGEQEENMELIMGVPLEISVEIGRTRKMVKDILDFTKGSLVVLDKLAGEQVDLFVNGQCIAKGDVVVVEDNFGIRITEILKSKFTIVE